jgi:hypothetical protein
MLIPESLLLLLTESQGLGAALGSPDFYPRVSACDLPIGFASLCVPC